MDLLLQPVQLIYLVATMLSGVVALVYVLSASTLKQSIYLTIYSVPFFLLEYAFSNGAYVALSVLLLLGYIKTIDKFSKYLEKQEVGI